MKLLIDMNLSPSWVAYLGTRGFESVHWSSVGKPSAPDREIFDYAQASGFVIFTHDLDFGTLLARGRANGPSVLQLRSQAILPGEIGDIVVRALRATATYLESGALVTVDPQRSRIRILPI